MDIKRVKCPKCNSLWDVKNNKNEAVKKFACPICKTPLQVVFQMPYNFGDTSESDTILPDDGHTMLFDEGRTVLPELQVKEETCYLVVNGNNYDLLLGRNTVGRKATTSVASIQFVTDDMYMSRHHSVINVRRMTSGEIKVDISNYENKNKTFVNGNILQNGESFVLHDGDSIKMGNTTVIYKTK